MVKSGFVTMETINKRKRSVEKIIGERLALKDARRACGQRMLDRGVPIERVSYAMRHDSIKTTQKYYANYRKKAVLDNIYGAIKGKPDGMP
ncbi:MAG: site-specific integrase [Candidatus Methanomethylophilaceae archaeon]|nr:site-specific integrase [Candidatus Methanomethylophilaceae archaeon]